MTSYVYLSDVLHSPDESENYASLWKPAFRRCGWFTRGWMLQEFIAPKHAAFFSREGQLLNVKVSLLRTLHEITGVALRTLKGNPLNESSVNKGMSWANDHQTKREEKAKYSLLGRFDVQLPHLHSEGRHKFPSRLRKYIADSSFDIDLFASLRRWLDPPDPAANYHNSLQR